MKRIELAFEKFKDMARCEIAPRYCPVDVHASLPDIDMKSRVVDDEGNVEGCRGITCDECWNSDEGVNSMSEKIKVTSAEIVVHGTSEKPYYEIKYQCVEDGECHVGYSSYDLNNVFEWLEECFEIVGVE